jgi:hypothetical protein
MSGSPMTALGAPALDVVRIRRTYTAVLGDPRVGGPRLGEEQRAHVAGLLRGQLRLMLPTVALRAFGIESAFNRSAAYLVVEQALAALDVPIRGASSAEYVYDLAVLSRSLLALHDPTA